MGVFFFFSCFDLGGLHYFIILLFCLRGLFLRSRLRAVFGISLRVRVDFCGTAQRPTVAVAEFADGWAARAGIDHGG